MKEQIHVGKAEATEDQGIEDEGGEKKTILEEGKVKNNKMTRYGQKRQEGEEK
jgi:hypothetical protein